MPELTRSLLLSWSVCWLFASPAAAQNLVLNGDFDQNLAFWELLNPNFTAFWDPLDVDADAGSGSARVVSAQPSEGSPTAAGSGLLQCLDVTPGSRLEASAWIYVPSGQARTAMPDVSVVFFNQPSCIDFLCNMGTVACGSSLAPQVGSVDAWTFTQTVFDVPNDVRSLRIFLRPRKVEAGGSVDVHFDAVFVPEPGAGASCAVAALALAALARRRG